MTADEMFKAAVEMQDWFGFVRAVGTERNRRWGVQREREADRLETTMDMTPEGFVREWSRCGRTSKYPLDAWEHAYNRAGLIQAAEERGYIRIGRDVGCTITMEPAGEALLDTVSVSPSRDALMLPLNGTKKHPLTQHARTVLAGLARGPIPAMEINAGVINRFHREGLTETVELPSPYKAHKGKTCQHERITDAGHAALADQP